MSKPGKVLKGLCKKLGVRLTVKRGKKRVYKSVAVLKRQCAAKKKKKKVKKVVKRRAKFGMGGVVGAIHQQNALRAKERVDKAMNIPGIRRKILGFMGEMNKNTVTAELEKLIKQREYSTRRIQELLSSVHATGPIIRMEKRG